jgi:hypothetical protein
MKTTRTMPLLALLALAGALAAVAPAALASHASLTIHHQVRGCHSWSLNGGAYKASQTIAIRRGGSIDVTNHDMMPHKLIETSGHAVVYTRLARGGAIGMDGTFAPAMLARMGSVTRITFSKAGTYHLTTRAGDDYMPVKTVGEDNVLRLTVRVG